MTPSRSYEVMHVPSNREGVANRLAGIALGTSTVLTPNIPIQILGLLRSNVMPLSDHIDRKSDFLHYGEVRIGTPAEGVTIRVDTGSADLLVPADCPTCAGTQFEPKHSRTHQSGEGTFEEHYVRTLDLPARG